MPSRPLARGCTSPSWPSATWPAGGSQRRVAAIRIGATGATFPTGIATATRPSPAATRHKGGARRRRTNNLRRRISGVQRTGFGGLEVENGLASRDLWRCEVQVRQVLRRPRGGSAIRLPRRPPCPRRPDRSRPLAGLEEVVGPEPCDAPDDLPNVVLGKSDYDTLLAGHL